MAASLIALAGAIGGWLLKELADRLTWRREQRLSSYLEYLESVDRFSAACSALWQSGAAGRDRDAAWTARSAEVRELLTAQDRINGKVRTVGTERAAWRAFDLHVACEKMWRRAIADPPTPPDRFAEAARDMVSAYHAFVEVARRDLAVATPLQRIRRGRPSFFELTRLRFEELNHSDPVPAGAADTVDGHAAAV